MQVVSLSGGLKKNCTWEKQMKKYTGLTSIPAKCKSTWNLSLWNLNLCICNEMMSYWVRVGHNYYN